MAAKDCPPQLLMNPAAAQSGSIPIQTDSTMNSGPIWLSLMSDVAEKRQQVTPIQVSTLHRKYTDLKRACIHWRKEADRYTKQAINFQAELADKTLTLESLESQLVDLRVKMTGNEQIHNDLVLEAIEARGETLQCEQKNEHIKMELYQKVNECLKLKSQLVQVQKKLSNVEEKFEIAEKLCKTLKQSEETLAERLKHCEIQLEEKDVKLQNVHKELNQLTKKVTRSESEQFEKDRKLSNRVEELKSVVRNLKLQLRDKSQLSNVEEKFKIADKLCETLKKNEESLVEKLKHCEIQLEEKDLKLEKLQNVQQELDELIEKVATSESKQLQNDNKLSQKVEENESIVRNLKLQLRVKKQNYKLLLTEIETEKIRSEELKKDLINLSRLYQCNRELFINESKISSKLKKDLADANSEIEIQKTKSESPETKFNVKRKSEWDASMEEKLPKVAKVNEKTPEKLTKEVEKLKHIIELSQESNSILSKQYGSLVLVNKSLSSELEGFKSYMNVGHKATLTKLHDTEQQLSKMKNENTVNSLTITELQKVLEATKGDKKYNEVLYNRCEKLKQMLTTKSKDAKQLLSKCEDLELKMKCISVVKKREDCSTALDMETKPSGNSGAMIEDLLTQLTRAQCENDALNSELASRDQQLQNYNSIIELTEELKRKLSVNNKSVKTLQQQLLEDKETNKNLTQKLEESEIQVKKSNTYSVMIEDLKIELSNSQCHCENLNIELAKSNSDIESLKLETSLQNKIIVELTQKLSLRQQLSDFNTNKYKDLETKLSNTELQLENLKIEFEKQKKSNEGLTNGELLQIQFVHSLKTQLSESQSVITNLQTSNNCVTSENAKLSIDLSVTQSQYDNLQLKYKTTKNHNQQLTSQLEEKQKQIENSNSCAAAMTEEYKIKISDLNSQLESLNVDLETLKAHDTELSSKLEQEKQLLKHDISFIKDLKLDLSTLYSHIEIFKLELVKEKKKNEEFSCVVSSAPVTMNETNHTELMALKEVNDKLSNTLVLFENKKTKSCSSDLPVLSSCEVGSQTDEQVRVVMGENEVGSTSGGNLIDYHHDEDINAEVAASVWNDRPGRSSYSAESSPVHPQQHLQNTNVTRYVPRPRFQNQNRGHRGTWGWRRASIESYQHVTHHSSNHDTWRPLPCEQLYLQQFYWAPY